MLNVIIIIKKLIIIITTERRLLGQRNLKASPYACDDAAISHLVKIDFPPPAPPAGGMAESREWSTGFTNPKEDHDEPTSGITPLRFRQHIVSPYRRDTARARIVLPSRGSFARKLDRAKFREATGESMGGGGDPSGINESVKGEGYYGAKGETTMLAPDQNTVTS